MTKTLRFLVLVDTEMPATDLHGTPLLAKERGADRLAAALTELGQDVVLTEAPLASAPPDRWVLYFGGDPSEALNRCGPRGQAVKARLVILDEDRVTAGELMQSPGPALVVTYRSFRNWLRDARTYAQVCGLTEVARALGIDLSPEDVAKPYELFTIPGAPLPEGIARYCAAVEEIRG
jgi:hypothetical protein